MRFKSQEPVVPSLIPGECLFWAWVNFVCICKYGMHLRHMRNLSEKLWVWKVILILCPVDSIAAKPLQLSFLRLENTALKIMQSARQFHGTFKVMEFAAVTTHPMLTISLPLLQQSRLCLLSPHQRAPATLLLSINFPYHSTIIRMLNSLSCIQTQYIIYTVSNVIQFK